MASAGREGMEAVELAVWAALYVWAASKANLRECGNTGKAASLCVSLIATIKGVWKQDAATLAIGQMEALLSMWGEAGMGCFLLLETQSLPWSPDTRPYSLSETTPVDQAGGNG